MVVTALSFFLILLILSPPSHFYASFLSLPLQSAQKPKTPYYAISLYPHLIPSLSKQRSHFLTPHQNLPPVLPFSTHFFFSLKPETSNYCCLKQVYSYIQSNEMEFYNDKTQDDLTFEIDEFQYRRKIGSFRPKFVGIPDDYIPLTCTEGLLYAMMLLMTIGSVLGIMIGFMFWITKHGLADFAAIWSAIFLAFVLIMIIAFYFGGKNRIKEEKQLIALAKKRQEQMKGEKGMKKD